MAGAKGVSLAPCRHCRNPSDLVPSSLAFVQSPNSVNSVYAAEHDYHVKASATAGAMSALLSVPGSPFAVVRTLVQVRTAVYPRNMLFHDSRLIATHSSYS